MDPRYINAEIFDRRRKEWSRDNIRSIVEELFQKVDMMPGWKFKSCDWYNVKSKKKKPKEELKNHFLQTLRITVENPQEEFVYYDIHIPELIGGQFFHIGGNLKIPMFQLLDHPVIYKKDVIRLRTNTVTINMDLKKGNSLQIFGKSIPISLLITTVHSKEELDEFINGLDSNNEIISAIYEECQTQWNTKSEMNRFDEIGTMFSTNRGDETKKGRGVAFSLKVAYEVDIFNKKLFKTNSVLFEILQAIHDGPRSDTTLDMKRIRMTEYLMAPLTKKIYEMLLSISGAEKDAFKIPRTIIFDNCNKSDIVRFSFPINPISELATLCQCSLTGPGGFKKDNVPTHLRDLDDSQKGRICPADTPDRAGCGVTLNMVPTVSLTEDGHFGEPNEEVVSSYPITLTPFMEHNDQTRLQMASNHAKQAILLVNKEKPHIRSGMEDMYHEYTTFMKKAPKDGTVRFINDVVMVVKYSDDEVDTFKIGYKDIFQSVVDIVKPKFREGEKFKKGDLLYESSFYDNGELALGNNLMCAMGMWDGFNYEDGIVIARSVAENKFTSIHHVDFYFTVDPSQVLLTLKDGEHQPLPKIGQKLKKGEPYAKIKVLGFDEGIESITMEPNELCAPIDCEVIDIEIFPNSWNTKTIDHQKFIETMNIQQTERFAIIENAIREAMGRNAVEFDEENDDIGEKKINHILKSMNLHRWDCMSKKESYTMKGKPINGVMFRIRAVYKERIGIGDKITNRHGNKGVIALIEEDENMPVLPDGRIVDIILNPLGVPSRMNAGQIFEMHLNESLYMLKEKMKTVSEEDGKSLLKEFLSKIDNTPTKWAADKIYKDFEENLKAKNFESAIDSLYIIQPPFQSLKPRQLFDIMEFTGAQCKYQMFHPNSKVNINTPLAAGKMYFNKLVHRASDKLSARSIGPYSKKTMQPLGGKARHGGHRCGEMEVWALLAHGSGNLLKDFLTVQSDSPGKKNELLASILNNPDLCEGDDSDHKPQSLRLFEANLKTLGLDIKYD